MASPGSFDSAPGTAGRSFNTWTGDGMHRGQAAVSLQEERGQVGPPNPLQIFPLPQQRLPIRLNNTGAVLFFFFHYEQLCLEQQDLDLGITFQESGAALQKPRWCLSSVCRGLEGSQERRWSCGFGVEGDFRELVGKVCVSQIPLAFISSVPRSELSRPYAHFGNCFICPHNILYGFQFINLLKSMKQIITWEY